MTVQFAQPAPVAGLSNCLFYQATDLLGFGKIEGVRKLRAIVAQRPK